MSSEYMIKKKSTPHCARGPQLCEKCAAAAKIQNICLLEIFFERGNQDRPVVEIVQDGETKYVEYDLIKFFKDEAEARAYAEKNNITRIEL